MKSEQLELDLQAAKLDEVGKTVGRSGEVVSLQQVRTKKTMRETAKLYRAILDSVEHITPTDQKFK